MSQLLFNQRRVLWMDPAPIPGPFETTGNDHCCAEMRLSLKNVCDDHADDVFACPDMVVAYSKTFDEYGLIIHDGGASLLLISACPFCGTKLPASRRDVWFERLEALGFDPMSDDIPEEFKSDAWYRNAAGGAPAPSDRG